MTPGPDHDDVQMLLSAYLDGEVTAAERATVEGHLEECDACAAELEALRSTVIAVAAMPPARPPDDFVDGVQRAIRHRSRGRWFDGDGRRPPGLRIGYDAVAVAMLAILVSFVVTLLPDVPPPAPILTGPPAAAGPSEPASYRVVAAGADRALVEARARALGASKVRRLEGGGLAVELPAGGARPLLDWLNSVTPMEVERHPPDGDGDRVELRF